MFSLPKVNTAKQLAIELAKRTKFLKEEVITQELAEAKATTGYLHGFYEAFKKYLVHDLTHDDFADLYAQTVTYGLFAARTRSGDSFNRKLAYDYIPKTIGILRDVFSFISSVDLPKPMEWIVDDISEVLAQAEVNNILHTYFREGKGKDPIVHFYETFLAEYDSKLREQRGVYYTPEPVVSYIVRSLNIILKEKFDKPNGFASEGVTVLDPAGGTLTFLAETAKLAAKEFSDSFGKGAVSKFIKENILKNFYSFELMMAPYAIGHIKMAFLLEELGYKLADEDRFKLYLTNTLEFEEFPSEDIPGVASLSKESKLAGEVKRKKPVLAIMGNPPYSGISTNKGKWITEEIKVYFKIDGKPLGEKKHWLNDDYVKFIRFAQWKIDQAGEGVLGFITNHGYLDNPTFRGMRQSLMNSFNEIYILDLHGNSLKKEKCPDGSPDKNVFDITQGVAIALFVKKKGAKGCEIRHTDLFGLRDKKYEWLLKKDKNSTKWKKLKPTSPYYFFIPRDESGRESYEANLNVVEIFPVNVTGIVTAKDKFVIDFDKDKLRSRILHFKNQNVSDHEIQTAYNLKENYMWKVSKARKELDELDSWEKYFYKVYYRPFDIREIYFHSSVVWRTRSNVMRHMMQDNLGLITSRMTKGETFKHAQVTQNIVEVICMSPKTSNNGFLFPLYLYPDKDKKNLFNHAAEAGEREPNINSKVFEALKKAYGKQPTPEDIFHYIYAVLYAPTYRKKYAEFLKIDFPRVPFTKDKKLFYELGKLGEKLVDLHLMKSKSLSKPIAKFEGEGDDKVEKLTYDAEQGRLYINKTQYFDGIPQEIYEYQIGGYQVCNKWLKDRKGRALSLDDIMHYSKVVTALGETIKLQEGIDKLYPKAEKEVIESLLSKII